MKKLLGILLVCFSTGVVAAARGGEHVSADLEGVGASGERKQSIKPKKPSLWSRLFGRSRGSSVSTGWKGAGQKGVGGGARNSSTEKAPGNPVTVAPVLVRDDEAPGSKERQAILKIANERGLRALVRIDSKFYGKPPTLTSGQLKLYQTLIEKFEQNPEYLLTEDDLKVDGKDLVNSRADRSLVVRIINSARSIALFKIRVTWDLLPFEKLLLDRYLKKGNEQGDFLQQDSVAAYKLRISNALEAEDKLIFWMNEYLFAEWAAKALQNVRRITGEKITEEGALSLLIRWSKTPATITKIADEFLKLPHVVAYLKTILFLKMDLDEAPFSKAEMELFNKVFPLDEIKKEIELSGPNEKIGKRVGEIIKAETAVVKAMSQLSSEENAKAYLEKQKVQITGKQNSDDADTLSVINALLEGDLYKKVYAQVRWSGKFRNS